MHLAKYVDSDQKSEDREKDEYIIPLSHQA